MFLWQEDLLLWLNYYINVHDIQHNVRSYTERTYICIGAN